MPGFAPHGRDAGPPDAGQAPSEREGENPVPVSGVSTRAFGQQLDRLDELGGGLQDPDRLCVGLQHSCAIDANHNARCWGGNVAGQTDVPADLPPLMSIACNIVATCALDETGKIWCWGEAGTPPEGSFTRITGYPEGAHMCALTESGEAACWENGYSDIIGGGAYVMGGEGGEKVPPGTLFSSISAGPGQTCGTELNTGAIVCWGDCNNEFGVSCKPIPIIEGSFVEIAVGGYHKCARTADGQVQCWGAGMQRVPEGKTCMDLDVGYECGQSAPPPLAEGVRYERLRLGTVHSCAVASNYIPVCWGWELRNLSIPPPRENVSQIAAGWSHNCALRTKGDIICWGETTNRRTNPPGDFAAAPTP